MITLERQSSIPVYQQIVSKLEEYIIRGILAPGEQLPSVRALAVELSINPNTIQKAYAELERSGVAVSVPGKGRFVTEDIRPIKKVKAQALLKEVSALVREARLLGVSEEDINAAVRMPGKGSDDQ